MAPLPRRPKGVVTVDRWEAVRQHLREICNKALDQDDRQVDANDLLIYMEILDETAA